MLICMRRRDPKACRAWDWDLREVELGSRVMERSTFPVDPRNRRRVQRRREAEQRGKKGGEKERRRLTLLSFVHLDFSHDLLPVDLAFSLDSQLRDRLRRSLGDLVPVLRLNEYSHLSSNGVGRLHRHFEVLQKQEKERKRAKSQLSSLCHVSSLPSSEIDRSTMI